MTTLATLEMSVCYILLMPGSIGQEWPSKLKKSAESFNVVFRGRLCLKLLHLCKTFLPHTHLGGSIAVAIKDQKAKTITKALWENFFVHYGFPSRLLSDQGRDFKSKTIQELCTLIGAEKIHTTPYHPRGNPVELFNRTLLDMLGTLEDRDKYQWCDFVKPLVQTYNYKRNDTTGYSCY